MAYTMKQVEKLTGVSAHTLRYWAKCGLFSHLDRDDNGYRYFSQRDLQWVGLVQCMRQTGMSIAKVLEFVELCKMGDSTLPKRIEMMKAQESEILSTIATYTKALEAVRKKIKILKSKDNLTLGKSPKLQNYYNKSKPYTSLKDNAGSKKRVSKSYILTENANA